MTNAMNYSISARRISCSVLGRVVILLATMALVTAVIAFTVLAQSKPHVATIRATDSSDGSRVTINADLSLSDYEAYRRGDRFYVKIPSLDLTRAQTLKGRGFEDVKVQRTGDGTLLSFRL